MVDNFGQEFQIERIGAVGLGLGWIVMDFEENSVYAGSHRRARQQGNEFGLAAALYRGVSPLPDPADGSCTECVPSKTTGANWRMMASERMSTTRLL